MPVKISKFDLILLKRSVKPEMILRRHRSSPKPTKLLPELLMGRNPDKNFVGFGEKQFLQKFISVHTDL